MTRKPTSLWSIALYSGTSPLALKPLQGVGTPLLTRDDVQDIDARFVADPFMVRKDGQWLLFFEVMNGSTGLGEVGLTTSSDGITWSYQGTVLRETFHLSYPHIYQWDGEFYMVPETVTSGYVQCYRSKRFPYEWELERRLLAAHFADATIFRKDESWWMLACATPAMHDSLVLFRADHPLAAWSPHPMNPLIQGNREIARPAGKVIDYQGRLIRFAQDCTPQYGSRVRAFEILELTRSTYRECELPESPILEPGTEWNSAGMHHIDAHETGPDRWIACVDGYCLVHSR